MTGIVIRSSGVCTDRTLPMRNPLWSPTFLATRLTLNLDAQVGLAIDGSNEVTRWTDQARNVVLAQSAGDGAIKSYDFNGVSVPRFTLDGYAAPDTITTSAFYGFFAVLDILNTDNALQNLLFSDAFSVYRNASGNWQIGGLNGGNFIPGSQTAGKQIVALYTDVAGTYRFRVNGTQLGSAANSAVAKALGQVRFGTYDPGVRDAAIAAMGITNGLYSLAEVQKLEGYLANRYGMLGLLPGDHPYKATLPRKFS